MREKVSKRSTEVSRLCRLAPKIELPNNKISYDTAETYNMPSKIPVN